jgi:hypothetical protein
MSKYVFWKLHNLSITEQTGDLHGSVKERSQRSAESAVSNPAPENTPYTFPAPIGKPELHPNTATEMAWLTVIPIQLSIPGNYLSGSNTTISTALTRLSAIDLPLRASALKMDNVLRNYS